ncbi:MAG TPA: ABC transporter permease subunit [Polyangiaceae bacterium]|nr:ABC transporter permease subunit [Polyangiaceae bacterium]
MSAMTTIAKREFRSNFDSPLAYVVICLSFLGLGLLFFLYRGGFWQLDRASVAGIFDYAPLGLALLVVPVVTMRLLAEERRSGTLEMLITLPVKDSDVILGKYIGALSLVFTVIVATMAYPIAMFMWPWNLGPLDWGPVFAGYFGLALFAAAAVSIGLLVTALTDSQAIAFFVTVFVLAALWFMGPGSELFGGSLAHLFQYVSFQTRLEGFSRGLIDTRDVVYFLSVTAVCLAVAFRALERRKWT